MMRGSTSRQTRDGSLEFQPTLLSDGAVETLHIDALVQLANDSLASHENLHVNLHQTPEAMATILRIGNSAGGARTKAVISWNSLTGEIRSGQVAPEAGFESWLLKFDGVAANRDKETGDPLGYGRIEYAYHLMARAAGITMSDCRLLEENDRAHFMTRRFDRDAVGGKYHIPSLCGMAHFDFNQAGAYSYEQAFQVARRLGLPQPDLTELYRRAIFNILSRNLDDHTKNIAFRMERDGTWRLAPAFDLIYAYIPSGAWTSRHQMSLSGKRDNFTRADLLEAAGAADLRPPQARTILKQLHDSIMCWKTHAKSAAVPAAWAEEILRNLQLDLAAGRVPDKRKR
jgi:serine/threonine-protein kinase HipA